MAKLKAGRLTTRGHRYGTLATMPSSAGLSGTTGGKASSLSTSRSFVMPLLQFDLIEGRTETELKTLLDAAHRAMLSTFKVPERDRFQIMHEHNRSPMIIEDRRLAPQRTATGLAVQITSHPEH